MSENNEPIRWWFTEAWERFGFWDDAPRLQWVGHCRRLMDTRILLPVDRLGRDRREYIRNCVLRYVNVSDIQLDARARFAAKNPRTVTPQDVEHIIARRAALRDVPFRVGVTAMVDGHIKLDGIGKSSRAIIGYLLEAYLDEIGRE